MKKLTSIALVAVFALSLALVAAPVAKADTVTVNATVASSLTFSASAGPINYNVDPAVASGRDTTKSTLLTVATNEGYSVSQQINKPLTSTGIPADTIPNNTFAIAGDNYFGYNLVGAGNATAAFTLGGSTIWSSVGAATNSVTQTVYYDLNVDYLSKAHADYTATITYTAVANP